MPRPTPWFAKLDADQRAELRQMVLDPSNSYSDIAEMYGRTPSDISYVAKKWGALPRHVNKQTAKESGRTLTLTVVNAQLEDLAKKRQAIKEEEEKLLALRVELSVRFERDGDDVLVWGIAEDSALRAPVAGWLRFLNAEGGRKLREFISKTGASRD